MSTLRRLPALLALVLAAAAAFSAASASAAPACPPGKIRVTGSGAPSCVALTTLRARVPAGGAAAVARRAIAHAESAAVRKALAGPAYVPRLGAAAKRARARAGALARAAADVDAPAGRVPAAFAAVAAPRQPAAIETQVRPLSGMPGWTGQTTVRSWDAAPDREVFGARAETVAERTDDGARARVVKGHTEGGWLERCPDASGTVRGTWSFGTVDRMLGVSANGDGAEQGISAQTSAKIMVHVADDASIASYDIEVVHDLQVTGQEFQGGRATHLPTRSYRGRLVLEGVQVGTSLRGLMTATNLRALGVWGPKGRVPLDADKAVWTSFLIGANLLVDSLQSGLRTVQIGWAEAGACFDVDFSPGGRSPQARLELTAGATQHVDVHVVDREGREVEVSLPLDSSANLKTSVAGIDAPGGFELTALTAGANGTIAVRAVSRRGLVFGILAVPAEERPADGPMKFTVLSARFEETTVGETMEEGNVCDLIGLPMGGRGTFVGGTDIPSIAEGSVMTRSDGSLRGTISTRIPARHTDIRLHGCMRGSGTATLVPCETTLPDDIPRPDGLWPMGGNITAAPGAATATITVKASNPHVGYLDADDSVCRVYPVEQWLPDELRSATIPVAQLRGFEPFTVELAGSHVWDASVGFPGRLEFAWTYSLTLKRLQ